VLLLWAWADSVTTSTSWLRNLDDGSVQCVFVLESEVAAGVFSPVPARAAPHSRQQPFFGRIVRNKVSWLPPRPRPASLFPALWREDGIRPPPYVPYHYRLVHTPLWLILAAYLPLWLALSWWHARHKQKRLRASLPSSAQPQTDL
jgi:hypothetical protein